MIIAIAIADIVETCVVIEGLTFRNNHVVIITGSGLWTLRHRAFERNCLVVTEVSRNNSCEHQQANLGPAHSLTAVMSNCVSPNDSDAVDARSDVL